MNINEARSTLIKEVQNNGNFWDAVAINDAIEAARDPTDEDKRNRATLNVARSDVANKFAREVIELIIRHWPMEPPVKNGTSTAPPQEPNDA